LRLSGEYEFTGQTRITSLAFDYFLPTKGVIMKRNPGRPVTLSDKPFSTLTLRVSREFKQKLIHQAEAVDLTLTDYLIALVERDSQ